MTMPFLGSAVLMLLLSFSSKGGLEKYLFSWSLFTVGFSLLCDWSLWQLILLYQSGCLALSLVRKMGKCRKKSFPRG
ncbi:MAG: hypothetical protein IKJ74_05195 [Clostridia bacterium]|nr:hypothetical protein [Clostridia bacterium]